MIHGWICLIKIYKYKNIIFEYDQSSGPWPLKKNGDSKKRAGRKFYEIFNEFFNLSEDEQAKYKIQGGCIKF